MNDDIYYLDNPFLLEYPISLHDIEYSSVDVKQRAYQHAWYRVAHDMRECGIESYVMLLVEEKVNTALGLLCMRYRIYEQPVFDRIQMTEAAPSVAQYVPRGIYGEKHVIKTRPLMYRGIRARGIVVDGILFVAIPRIELDKVHEKV